MLSDDDETCWPSDTSQDEEGESNTEDANYHEIPSAAIATDISDASIDAQDSPWLPIQLVPGGPYCMKDKTFHTTKRPPVEASFLLGPFSLDMAIENFLEVISKPEYGLVIKKEFLSEDDSHSALSLLESVYPSYCARGKTFRTCLLLVLSEKYSKANYKEVFAKIVLLTKQFLFDDSSKYAAESKWGGDVVKNLTNAVFQKGKSDIEREYFKQEFTDRHKILPAMHKKVAHTAEADKKIAESMAIQVTFPRSTINEAMAEAIRDAKADVDCETIAGFVGRVFAVCLGSGGRLRCTFVSRLKEFEDSGSEDDERLKSMYGLPNGDQMISVSRLSKERPKATRAAQKTNGEMVRVKAEGGDLQNVVKLTEGDIIDRVVVKPLLPLISRDLFMQFWREIRQHRYLEAILIRKGLPLDVDAWSDTVVYGDGLGTLLSDIGDKVGSFSTKHFGDLLMKTTMSEKKRQKPIHALRALYARYAGDLFRPKTMGENLFIQTVLGHGNLQGSHSYMWLTISDCTVTPTLAATPEKVDLPEPEGLKESFPAFRGGTVIVSLPRKTWRHTAKKALLQGIQNESAEGEKDRKSEELHQYILTHLLPKNVDIQALTRLHLALLPFGRQVQGWYFDKYLKREVPAAGKVATVQELVKWPGVAKGTIVYHLMRGNPDGIKPRFHGHSKDPMDVRWRKLRICRKEIANFTDVDVSAITRRTLNEAGYAAQTRTDYFRPDFAEELDPQRIVAVMPEEKEKEKDKEMSIIVNTNFSVDDAVMPEESLESLRNFEDSDAPTASLQETLAAPVFAALVVPAEANDAKNKRSVDETSFDSEQSPKRHKVTPLEEVDAKIMSDNDEDGAEGAALITVAESVCGDEPIVMAAAFCGTDSVYLEESAVTECVDALPEHHAATNVAPSTAIATEPSVFISPLPLASTVESSMATSPIPAVTICVVIREQGTENAIVTHVDSAMSLCQILDSHHTQLDIVLYRPATCSMEEMKIRLRNYHLRNIWYSLPRIIDLEQLIGAPSHSTTNAPIAPATSPALPIQTATLIYLAGTGQQENTYQAQDPSTSTVCMQVGAVPVEIPPVVRLLTEQEKQENDRVNSFCQLLNSIQTLGIARPTANAMPATLIHQASSSTVCQQVDEMTCGVRAKPARLPLTEREKQEKRDQLVQNLEDRIVAKLAEWRITRWEVTSENLKHVTGAGQAKNDWLRKRDREICREHIIA